jgi:hypothetical protein
MTRIFKVLASVVAWILFLLGLQGIIVTFLQASRETASEIVGFFALWVVTLVLSVVVMKLRKSLD